MPVRPTPSLLATAAAAALCLAVPPPAAAQATVVIDGEPVQIPEGVDPGEFMRQRAEAMKNGGGPPGGDDKPDGEKEDGDDGEGGGDGPKERPEIIKRPTTPPPQDEGYDDRRLFDPDGDGEYVFNFRGAPWAAVLTQLADASNLSLDWQELPGDYLNLRTQRTYTAEEARDLINRHLLARGFTLLTNGEILSVANLKKLDPGLVPPADPDELKDLRPHAFVKVVFALDYLPAERAAEELKALLSPHGKLVALPGSNRLLAMDAAKNLREVAAVLTEEQSGRGRERAIARFPLKHVRADRAKELLEEFLGIDPDKDALPTDPRQAQMVLQMRMQAAQRGGGDKGGAPKEPEVRLIVNDRENSLLVQAPPEQMAVIERSVEALDVPRDPGEGLLAKIVTREEPVRIYRLARLDPELVVRLLSNSGELDPMTRIEVDAKANALVVNAPATDHLVIAKLVESLDGTDRSFEVIPLRRLPADYVAGTVKFMMGVEEEKSDGNSRRSRYSYFSYGYGSSGDDKKDEVEGRFRVDADVQKNRLLLWANPVELAEVNALLVKLGEVRATGSGRRPVRVLDVTDQQAAEILDRLETVWPRVRENPLTLPAEAPPAEPETLDEGDPVAAATPTVRTARYRRDTPDAANGSAAGNAGAAANTGAAEIAPAAPPVTVRRTPGRPAGARKRRPGRARRAGRPRRRTHPAAAGLPGLPTQAHRIHVLAGQSAGGLFRRPTARRRRFTTMWGDPVNVPKDAPDRLSKRKPLRFIGDIDTRTILVQNATPAQLRQIGDLLEIWDRAPEQKGGALRLTKLWSLENAKASEVAATLKDVYRDLLSTNDPALKSKDDEKKSEPSAPSTTYIYGRNNGGGEDDGREPDPPIRFKGLISVGVHDESNTLVVSASEGLMANVEMLVDSLEANARATDAASMMWRGGETGTEEVKSRLKDMFGDRVSVAPSSEDAPVRVGEARAPGGAE